MNLCTIGASKKSAEGFFSALGRNKIEKLIDIRLNNKSQLLGFSKGRDLEYFCKKCHDIEYEHVPIFAPTKDVLSKYKKDKDWEAYERSYSKLLESRAIIDLFNKTAGEYQNVCLLCSEPKADKCHRRLVAEFIASRLNKVKVIHI